ncbi:MAG: hypothetical protein ACJA01_004348 [Saprospiraceae bacterium]|jgi:hypothetical protein
MFISFAFFNLAFVFFTRLVSLISGKDTTAMISGFAALAYYGIGILVLIDFFTLGAFKKVKDKGFSTVFFWIYRFYGSMSLSFVYRPLLLNFIDNSYTRRLFFFAIPYALLILVGFQGVFFEKNIFIPSFSNRAEFSNQIGAASINWRYYDDLRTAHIYTFNNGNELPEKEKINHLSLDQYENDNNSLSIFLEFRSGDDDHIQEGFGISPFRKKGIGHRLFSRGKEEDPGLQKIDSLYLVRSKLLTDIIRNPDKEINAEHLTTYASDIEIWKKFNEDDISRLRDELKSDRSAQKNNYFENKLQSIKDELTKMYTFKINEIEIQPSESYFMTHPNMHEKGVLCYFPLDSLPKGGHILDVIKQRERIACKDGCAPTYFSIPFRKI